ncbi:MAG TPA: 3-keto-5-aminohexanoate cleavage protein [Mycobacteriales bacterium]|nr:3-keto-5-aminohexanoate cleavage protein [Mycobacteriales bacterium]
MAPGPSDMAGGTLLTVAPTGAETAKSDFPPLPVTLEELVDAALACERAGASVIHVHLRDDAAEPTLDVGRARAAVVALRESTDLVVQLSTGGAVGDPEAARLLVLDADPDSASLSCGTVNFGDGVFLNRWPFMVELYRRMQERGIVPEFEIFDLGQIDAMLRLLDRFGPPSGGHVHADLVMGVPGGMPGTAAALIAAASALPAGATFSATGVGRTALPVAFAALAAGGHLRVGCEDTLSFAPGVAVRDNTQLVERAASLAGLAQRPPLSTVEARAMLGVTDRRGARRVAAGEAAAAAGGEQG